MNNAGIGGGFVPAALVDAAEMERVFATNVFGIVRVTKAFLPLLAVSQNPGIVNVGSALGSEGVITDPARIESGVPALDYASSKAAVIMLTSSTARRSPTSKSTWSSPASLPPTSTATEATSPLPRSSSEWRQSERTV